jgi:dCMP deaminase
MKAKFIAAFMDCAERFAQLSTATRAKVGAIIVKDNRIISIGYNGMPSGWSNECEDLELPDWAKSVDDITPDDRDIYLRYKTKPEVLHAETNAIAKMARSSESCDGAALFCTHLPCMDCAKLIYQSGITEVYYKVEYHASKGTGKDFLIRSGIKLAKIQ